MNIPFPAVIKDIHIGTDGILATLDISPPDLSIIAELIDQEVTVTVSAATPFPSSLLATPTAPVSADEKLPFEPDEDFGEFADADLPPQPPASSPKRPRRPAKRTK